MPEKRYTRKVICGACGNRVAEDAMRQAYRTTEDGFLRFRNHPVSGSTQTRLCPACYREWDVQTDGQPPPE